MDEHVMAGVPSLGPISLNSRAIIEKDEQNSKGKTQNSVTHKQLRTRKCWLARMCFSEILFLIRKEISLKLSTAYEVLMEETQALGFRASSEGHCVGQYSKL